ncbi:similar to Saccharomyces cerevisiae YDR513W GRX2 Cytoplasmic glutaredoxin [Maudiozyma barnettii]|uniref:Similar to Saccharomyces cerevisiae YDR513W GRX2 Cytoplasmic glutaredoxin n=1 Tax=Maudiozyma barnettii TaxID=61262 RepID=A0A8H2ZKJ1_9SACH|nr:dithiol glutaredoxin GRX2 [Kazachstania barnettii]CAB4255232.1 similar to Saccharomyces cerevisiae YDR513W GRX2 Cytoplasmic glutaredoxin [Kazachstania barnettii]CAD1783640.1 similar to Saccharomyces cerevisiae YDR513W GRX2 Cytoplasmic glutaredoxin [Kazachstania barnettii]
MNLFTGILLGLVVVVLIVKANPKPQTVSKEVVDQVQKMIDDNPVFVASKSYCPYCKETLNTLFEVLKVPVADALVLQLDTMDDGDQIQVALKQLNGQRTVPSIYIGQEFIGGNSDLQKLYTSGALKTKLEKVVRI